MAKIYSVLVCSLGAFVFLDAMRTLLSGGGNAGATGVTNALLSVIASLLLVISGQIAWIWSRGFDFGRGNATAATAPVPNPAMAAPTKS